MNGNGIQDDGDTGVEGVTVNLKDESGEVIETTTTGPDGSYSFTGLDPGTYSVQFVLPSGYQYSPVNIGDDALDSDADPAQNGMTATTTLASGENDPTLDAGIYQTASLGDYVWEDLNGNGIQDDGDTGVEGVTVNLKDESGEVIETTTTGPDGSYSFENLDPGTYSVQFVLPSGYQYSPVNIGDDALDSDADPAQNGMTATTTLASGENDPTLDAGIYQTTSLGDYVWEDLNGNGIQDDGDTGVEGVTVNLKDESGEVIETTTTGPDGSYSFTGLDPGTYSVQFVLPSGYQYSPVNIGDDALDSDADPAQNGMTATTTLASGENDPTLDAGIYQTASLGDYVWEDLNGNGIQDDGDTGVEGVTVNLKDERGGD
ncbi:MAG: SdrD B-like domain-containing protein [Saprospiraceae bacterium]